MRIGGREESTLIGVGVKVPAPLAAWANSVLASALDIDDGSLAPTGYAAGHHGAIVVPASLCVAESKGLSGKSFIEAVVVGYEVGIRAAYILSSLPGRHLAGPMGSYGATAASAKLLQLSKEEIANALGIVHVHNPTGSAFETTVGTLRMAMTKESVGWATLTGIFAVLLAQQGFTGPGSIYQNLHADQTLLSSLGREYETLKVYHKLYCSCRGTHPALDGLFRLMQKYNLSAEDIIKVKVGSRSTAKRLYDYRPYSIEQAQYSIPFVLGAALVDGKVGPEQMNERRLDDKAILDQARKVQLEVNPTINALQAMGAERAIVKIETKDGRIYETRVNNLKGSIENPLTEDELREKFRYLSTKLLGEQRTEEVIRCIDNLENLRDITDLVELVSYVG